MELYIVLVFEQTLLRRCSLFAGWWLMRPKHLALEPWKKRNDRRRTTTRWGMIDIILARVIEEADLIDWFLGGIWRSGNWQWQNLYLIVEGGEKWAINADFGRIQRFQLQNMQMYGWWRNEDMGGLLFVSFTYLPMGTLIHTQIKLKPHQRKEKKKKKKNLQPPTRYYIYQGKKVNGGRGQYVRRFK